MELGVRLKPMEKYVLKYGNNCEIIIINTGEVQQYSEMKYTLKHPAKKLRKRPVQFYVEKTNAEEIHQLKLKAENYEELTEPNFKGTLIKRKD